MAGSLADWIALRRPKYRSGGTSLAWLEPNADLVRWGPYRPIALNGSDSLPVVALEREEYFCGDFNQCRVIGAVTIERVDIWVDDADAHSNVTELSFRLWRPDSEVAPYSSWDCLYETENFESLIPNDSIAGGREVQCTLTTPWVCQAGDAASVLIRATDTDDYLDIVSLSQAEARHRDSGEVTPGGTGDITDLVNVDWPAHTTGQVTNNVVTIRMMGRAPSIVCVSDSWVSGTINSSTTEDGDTGYLATDAQATHGRAYTKAFPYKLSVLTGRSVMKSAVHGQNSTDLDGRFTADVINVKPKAAIIFAIGNDCRSDGTVPTVAALLAVFEGWFDAMDTAGIKYVVCGAGPYTGFTDQEMQRAEQFNEAIEAEIVANRPNGRWLDVMGLLGQARVIATNTGSITAVAVSAGVSYTIASDGHGLTAGEFVTISGIVGSGNMQGDLNASRLVVVSVDNAAAPDTFTVNDPDASGVYSTGGTWSLSDYTGNTWNMQAAYQSDTQHTTEAGYTAIAAAIYAKLLTFG